MATRKKKRRRSAWEEAERYGFDMSLIEANLKLTPLQRIREHSRALRMAQMLRLGMEQRRGRLANLENLLERLIKAKVKFVVIGGFAVMAHGVSLLTQDLDICCPMNFANMKRIEEALGDLDLRYRAHPLKQKIHITRAFCKDLQNLYLQTHIGKLDVLGDVPHFGDYKLVRKHSVEIDLGFGKCRVIDLDALIAIKSRIGRPRDRDAVRLLKALKEGPPKT